MPKVPGVDGLLVRWRPPAAVVSLADEIEVEVRSDCVRMLGTQQGLGVGCLTQRVLEIERYLCTTRDAREAILSCLGTEAVIGRSPPEAGRNDALSEHEEFCRRLTPQLNCG